MLVYVYLHRFAEISGCAEGSSEAEGVPDRRGPPDAGSRAHDDLGPAEARGLAGNRVRKDKSAIHP